MADASHIVWDFDPEIFHFDFINFSPRWYGLSFATGILLGYHLMRRIFLKEGRTEEELNSGFVLLVFGTIVGARLGHCLFYEPAYYLSKPWKILFIWEGGLASHGGTIGVFLCMMYFTKKYKLPFIWLADRLGIGVPLAVPFIRIGNFFNSEIYGHPSELPWAIVFKRVDEIPRHPSQLYEAAAYFALFFTQVLWYQLRGDKIRSGKLIGLMFIWIFAARFLIEFTKVNQVDFEAGMPLNMGQLLSIPMIFVGLFFWFDGHTKLGWTWEEGAPPGASEDRTDRTDNLDPQRKSTAAKQKEKRDKRKREKEAKRKNR